MQGSSPGSFWPTTSFSAGGLFPEASGTPDQGIGIETPSVMLDHTPEFREIPISTDEDLARVSEERNLFLNPNDIPTIRSYFLDPKVIEERKEVGLSLPTDVEIEYISQARSDHCNHNTFKGLFRYRDLATGEEQVLDNLFKTCIEKPTLEIKEQKDWVVSVLWDNAGVGKLDDDHYYTITGETHNSPSNMEAYGGAITGIVGVYRDPMGTGKGSKLIAGTYGYCVGHMDYNGPLKPHLHPRRLLDGIIEGVKDGGNKSGIPTAFGQVFFHDGYLGKCLVFVTAIGLMPAQVDAQPSHEKKTSPGELIIMCGGRVGKDGIHGVTASSSGYTRAHSRGPCADRRSVHSEKNARLPSGSAGRGADRLYHRQRRRRAVFVHRRIGPLQQRRCSRPGQGPAEIRWFGHVGNLGVRIPGAHDRCRKARTSWTGLWNSPASMRWKAR